MSQSDGSDPDVGWTESPFADSSRTTAAEAAEAITEPLPTVQPPTSDGYGPDGYGQDRRPGDELFDEEQFEEDDSEEIAHIAVRPYVLTGGRTRPAVDLAIEALVSVPAGAPDTDRRPDHAAVLALCDAPRSVAEIAALMQVALGVARVLVGDLAESGAVIVHDTSGAAGPDLALLERVLGGLRRL